MRTVSHFPRSSTGTGAGFTLVELLVSMSILSILLLLLTQLLDQVQRTWRYSESRVSQFREARVAFDVITKNLAQASLHNYLEVPIDPKTNRPKGSNFQRISDLHFLTVRGQDLGTTSDGTITSHAIFFQAPLGYSVTLRNLNNLFNARGYYLLYGSDEGFQPKFLRSRTTERFRFRLMEYRPPAEENMVFIDGDRAREGDNPSFTDWFRHDLSKFSHPLAENIVALVVAPRDTVEKSTENRRDTYSRIARDYQFDSNTHQDKRFVQQLPPLVRVTMVAIDEDSVIRMRDGGSASMPGLVDPGLFSDSRQFDDDVEKLKSDLNSQRINHKVFSTIVAIRSSKWGGDVATGK